MTTTDPAPGAMTAEEHIREARRFAAAAEERDSIFDRSADLQAAQVHATIAQTLEAARWGQVLARLAASIDPQERAAGDGPVTGEQPEARAVPGVTRWRKRPVEVEAIQWTGGNLADVQAFCGPGYFEAVPPGDRDPDPDMTAQVYDKLHGTWVHVYDGQWVIRGVQGELYPISAEVLAATYDKVID